MSAGSFKRLSGPFSKLSRGCWFCVRQKAAPHFFMSSKLTGVSLANAFFNERDVVFVQREVLIDGFVEDEAAVALLEGGEGVEGFDLVAGGAEGDCLLLHALRIPCITQEDKWRNLRLGWFGSRLDCWEQTHPSCARMGRSYPEQLP
jgi:hypothetical protein